MTTTLLFPHGLGDVIQALPSFERYAAKIGDRLTVGVLARLPACREALQGAPWCAGVLALSDPWNDFEPANTWDGYRAGVASIERDHPTGRYLTTARPCIATDPAWSKAVRIAMELGVDHTPTRPDLTHLDAAERAAGDLWARLERPAGERLALIHGESGQPRKDVSHAVLRQTASCAFSFQTTLRPGAPDLRPTHSVPLPLRDEHGRARSLAFHAGALAAADLFVGIDSGPAHLASAVAANVLWVFTTTPVEQALPLYRPVSWLTLGPHRFDLAEGWGAWREANGSLCRHEALGTVGGGI